jgi:hypothetical protein
MRVRQIVLLAATVGLLSGCAGARQSSLNPFNWFKRGEEAAPVVGRPADPRAVVAEVIALDLAPTLGGAILRASGRTTSLGWYEAGLLPAGEEAEEDVRIFRLVAFPPPEGLEAAGSAAQRQIEAARFLPDSELEGVARIIVEAGNGSRSVTVGE